MWLQKQHPYLAIFIPVLKVYFFFLDAEKGSSVTLSVHHNLPSSLKPSARKVGSFALLSVTIILRLYNWNLDFNLFYIIGIDICIHIALLYERFICLETQDIINHDEYNSPYCPLMLKYNLAWQFNGRENPLAVPGRDHDMMYVFALDSSKSN